MRNTPSFDGDHLCLTWGYDKMQHILVVLLSRLNDLEDIGQGQRSLCMAYPLMPFALNMEIIFPEL